MILRKTCTPKNCKTLMREIEEDTVNGKKSCVRGLEELILLKCPYYPKQFIDSVQFLKISTAFFTEIGNHKIHMEPQRPEKPK